MIFWPGGRPPDSTCGAQVVKSEDRRANVRSCAHRFLLPSMVNVSCWACRAMLISEVLEACVELAMDMPDEQRLFVLETLHRIGEEVVKRSANAKAIAADAIKGSP